MTLSVPAKIMRATAEGEFFIRVGMLVYSTCIGQNASLLLSSC